MSRVASGTVRILRNEAGQRQWHAKFTLANGERGRWVPIPAAGDHPIALDDLEGAKRYAAGLAPQVKAAGVTGNPIETVQAYAERWCAWREGRGLGCVRDDRILLRIHALPLIGRLDVRQVARDDLKRFVSELDARARAGFRLDTEGNRHRFGWKTAVNVWSVARALFRDAQRAKDVAMCVRDDNPAQGVAGPDAGAWKSKQYVWPSEFEALMACQRIPLRWRRLFALAVYTYVRAGELAALRWEDVDLEHGTIHVHRSLDRTRGKGAVKGTKSDAARRIPIEGNLRPLLEAMRDATKGKGPVLRLPGDGLSAKLRSCLRRAGVERADLFASDATRKAVTFHDLRATGITWMAARGDDPLRIMQRAGHEDFETTKIYMREAENLVAGFGTVFPELPPELLGNRPESPRDDSKSRKQPKTSGSRWPLRDLNPNTLSGRGF
jgi:integrase